MPLQVREINQKNQFAMTMNVFIIQIILIFKNVAYFLTIQVIYCKKFVDTKLNIGQR